ncbi:MAG TPA: DUF1993 domain-containing protein [Aestuariivirgaceae bacterium]|nr:DUF1993 domain-containing protein [Aestuariivirgaceae bacterium]
MRFLSHVTHIHVNETAHCFPGQTDGTLTPLMKEPSMAITMYRASVPQLEQMLRNLLTIIDKALAHASARKIDPQVLLAMRLSPDMFPLVRQVQTVTDFAKAIAFRLAGREPPKWDDTEKTFEELKTRIDKALKILQAVKPDDFEGSQMREITVSPGGRMLKFKGDDYLFNFALPNFYFHVTIAYAILRHAGVELGKSDYIGPLSR